MSALFLSLLLKIGPYLAIAAGALFGALKWRSSIIKGERAKQAAAEAKARDIADEVQNDIGAMPPDEARKELGKWSRG